MVTAQDIEGLFAAQLNGIGNPDLRRKTIAVWVEGCRRGGWETVADLKTMPFTLLTETHGISTVEHTIAVTEGAVGLAEAQRKAYARMPYAVDMDRLVAGGLLHDVGKLMEAEKDGRGGFRKSKGRPARAPPDIGRDSCRAVRPARRRGQYDCLPRKGGRRRTESD